MKGYSYHSLFYYQILSALKLLKGADGTQLKDLVKVKEAPQFFLGWEPRTTRFRHNYERTRFLNTRDTYVAGQHPANGNDVTVAIRQPKGTDDVVIYQKAVEHLFGSDWEDAMRELKTLLEKFYTVQVEERSELGELDLSQTSREPSHIRINDLRRV